MNLKEYAILDATALGELVAAGEVSAAELAATARAGYEALNPTLNAIIEFYDDAETVRGSDSGIFPGVPFLRKDVGATEAGRLQELGSRLFKGYRPTENSYYIERAWAQGIRIIGRGAVSELATSGFTESIVNGITHNPWNLARTAGGSTGGGSASVAAGIVPLAQASDGGGSIRVPTGDNDLQLYVIRLFYGHLDRTSAAWIGQFLCHAVVHRLLTERKTKCVAIQLCFLNTPQYCAEIELRSPGTGEFFDNTVPSFILWWSDGSGFPDRLRRSYR